MKFSEMKYERLDAEAVKRGYAELTGELTAADSYEKARSVFLRMETFSGHVETMSTLVCIRHSIDTGDAFYDEENRYWDSVMPEIEEVRQDWKKALLESPWRGDFAGEYGDLMFVNAELARKTFSPEIIPELQRENELMSEYGKLKASARIPFEGGVYTLSQMTPFKSDADDARRLAAWKAEGAWYKEKQPELDRIYDELTKLRDSMGRKLGYGGYIPLGYYRMGRNCYGEEDVKRFREYVRKYLVPVAAEIYRKQAERLGFAYPLSFAEEHLEFRSGNPRPVGTAADILAAGKKFYEELSPESGVFFNRMLDDGLMDVLSTEGKESGGYCTDIPDYGVPFIFANFNGTQGDVEVVSHEAGHAFEAWLNRDRVPREYSCPGMEGAEVHSMSMEFFMEGWAEDFFGADADKFRYSHLAGALKFIPYGTMVDHFQHIVYERPNMTPAERHGVWKELLGVYMPWLKLDGDIPVYAEGQGWQRQGHIYQSPFYYIDYCLAQTVSLEFWDLLRQDPEEAWERYMAFTRQGGSRVFTELLKNAGLDSPFEEETFRGVCARAEQWLREFDTDSLE